MFFQRIISVGNIRKNGNRLECNACIDICITYCCCGSSCCKYTAKFSEMWAFILRINSNCLFVKLLKSERKLCQVLTRINLAGCIYDVGQRMILLISSWLQGKSVLQLDIWATCILEVLAQKLFQLAPPTNIFMSRINCKFFCNLNSQ